MSVQAKRESFIPYRRSDLVELCLQEGRLPEAQAQKFRDFCTILAAYYHFQFHHTLEQLKDCFAPFNPDADTHQRRSLSDEEQVVMADKLVTTFAHLLERANYFSLSQDGLKRAFKRKSLIELNTDVDFDDFKRMVCYVRGDIFKTAEFKKFIFWKTERRIDIFERVAVLMQFKDEEYFQERNVKIETLDFVPGRMYLYLYRNIPKFDIEFLFPNVKISMTWRDRILLLVPAIGAGVSLMIKALPQLLLIVGAVLFFLNAPEFLEGWKASEEEVRDFMPTLTALMSLLLMFGGFAFKQYSTYQHKQLKFQQNVTETLFFRNIASNLGVFYNLIDAAEEEECKEIILVYYHLLTQETPVSPEQLDRIIEDWMQNNFETIINFDIKGAVDNLTQIRGARPSSNDSESYPDVPLLTYDPQGRCHVLPLDDAKYVIDSVWDQAFQYANSVCE